MSKKIAYKQEEKRAFIALLVELFSVNCPVNVIGMCSVKGQVCDKAHCNLRDKFKTSLSGINPNYLNPGNENK